MVKNQLSDSSRIPDLARAIIYSVMATEGGFADIEGDPGGQTQYGIAYNFAIHIDPLVAQKIRNRSLTLEEATLYYYKRYYLAFNIPKYSDDRIKYFMYDSRVAGLGWYTRFIQQALKYLGRHLVVDGKYGKLTDMALQSLDRVEVTEFLERLQRNSTIQARYWKSTPLGARMNSVRAAAIQRRLLIRTEMALSGSFYAFGSLAKEHKFHQAILLTQELANAARENLQQEGIDLA